MDANELKKASKNNLAREIATRHTDPLFYSALTVLPNPDAVLRKLGRAEDVFDAIAYDAHVIGELRSIRAGMLRFEWRLEPGGDAPADKHALELCEQYMAQRPAPNLRWQDTIWNMALAIFRGFQVHEVVWGRQDRYLMPVALIDRPSRRFRFGAGSNELRLITRNNQTDGEELGPYKWLLTRHMPSYDNPYGMALYSACFWPYTFKHSGWRYFVKFCEKYGIPKAVGKYPVGTPKPDQDALADALAQMVEDNVAAIPDGGSVELLETNISGQLVHERLINLCNREMSKALTSQTLATEIQGEGSRAASEIHREREEGVNESDRAVIEDAMSELFAWITELNVPGAKPPRFQFYEEAEARQDWVDVLDKARQYVDVPKWFAHERLQIPQPVDGEEVLPRGSAPGPALEFAASSQGTDVPGTVQGALDTEAARNPGWDEIMLPLLQPIFDALENGLTPEEILAQMDEWYPRMDSSRLIDLLERGIAAAETVGRIEAAHNG